MTSFLFMALGCFAFALLVLLFGACLWLIGEHYRVRNGWHFGEPRPPRTIREYVDRREEKLRRTSKT